MFAYAFSNDDLKRKKQLIKDSKVRKAYAKMYRNKMLAEY